MGAGRDQVLARHGAVHQLPLGVVDDRLHEGVRHADRDVEVVPAARVRLAVMNSRTSGWSMRSTPIWAPRRAPALSTVEQDWSKTLM